MKLLDLITRYISEHETGIAKSTADNYKRSIRRFGDHLGRDAEVSDLTTPAINGWLDSLKGTMSETTRKNQRTAIKVCINFAFEEELLEAKPRKIRKITPEKQTPKAWRLEQVKELIRLASQEKTWDFEAYYSPDIDEAIELIHSMREGGASFQTIADELTNRNLRTPKGVGPWHRNVCRRIHLRTSEAFRCAYRNRLQGFRKSQIMPALLALGWETGMRLGDLLSLKPSDLYKNGDKHYFRKTMNKTKFVASGGLSVKTYAMLEGLRSVGPERETYFPPIAKTTLSRMMAHLCKVADLDGSTKFLRRGAASHAESLRFGAGTELLGHRTRSITVDNYIDPSIAQPSFVEIPSAFSDEEERESGADGLHLTESTANGSQLTDEKRLQSIVASLASCDQQTLSAIASLLHGGPPQCQS